MPKLKDFPTQEEIVERIKRNKEIIRRKQEHAYNRFIEYEYQGVGTYRKSEDMHGYFFEILESKLPENLFLTKSILSFTIREKNKVFASIKEYIKNSLTK